MPDQPWCGFDGFDAGKGRNFTKQVIELGSQVDQIWKTVFNKDIEMREEYLRCVLYYVCYKNKNKNLYLYFVVNRYVLTWITNSFPNWKNSKRNWYAWVCLGFYMLVLAFRLRVAIKHRSLWKL